ncbi:hypothetical protein MMC30_002840 [Trapelia coarctata]|nr:hypothetical protein [Trapelia coarctata]
MRLHHLHLPHLTPYPRASFLQTHLVSTHLQHAASPLTSPAPPPYLLTFQTPPTYTCGRREILTLTPQQTTYLTATGAEFHPALRGGQTTFHGPGQVTAYLILTLKRHNLRPRTYVRFLEDSVIETVRRYGVRGFVTENPGVWVSEERKLASVGVHMRRGVSSHGVGLNVSTELGWFDRIVACGLVGKRATSLRGEGVDVEVGEVAGVLAEVMAGGLEGVEGVRGMDVREVEGMGGGGEGD